MAILRQLEKPFVGAEQIPGAAEVPHPGRERSDREGPTLE